MHEVFYIKIESNSKKMEKAEENKQVRYFPGKYVRYFPGKYLLIFLAFLQNFLNGIDTYIHTYIHTDGGYLIGPSPAGGQKYLSTNEFK